MRGAPCKNAIICWSKIWIFPPRRYQEKSGLLRTRLTYMCIHTPRCTFCTSPGYALNFDWWHSRWEFHIIRAAGPYLAEEIPARRRVPGKTWEFRRRTESTVDQNYATTLTRSQEGREGENVLDWHSSAMHSMNGILKCRKARIVGTFKPTWPKNKRQNWLLRMLVGDHAYWNT